MELSWRSLFGGKTLNKEIGFITGFPVLEKEQIDQKAFAGIRGEGQDKLSLMRVVLVSGPHLNPDRCPDKPECFPNLVFQESLIRKMQLHLAVGEENESWRRDRGLGQVEDFYTLANRHRRAIEIDLLQETVHLAGSDALAALCSDFFKGRV